MKSQFRKSDERQCFVSFSFLFLLVITMVVVWSVSDIQIDLCYNLIVLDAKAAQNFRLISNENMYYPAFEYLQLSLFQVVSLAETNLNRIQQRVATSTVQSTTVCIYLCCIVVYTKMKYDTKIFHCF